MPASIPAPTTLTSATTLGDTHSRMHGRNLKHVENVLAWGAVGDGTTNDATAIQACIDATSNAVIYFPPGTYKVNTGLSITNAGTTLQGAGMGASTIKAGAAFDKLVYADSKSDISLFDLHLDGNLTATKIVSLTASGGATASRLQVRRCRIRQNLVASNLWAVVFWDTQETNFLCNNIWFTDNIVEDCTGTTIDQVAFSLCERVIVRNNVFKNLGRVVINDRSKDVLYEGNVFQDFASYASLVMGGPRTVAVGNTFRDSQPVRIDGADNATFIGNTLDNTSLIVGSGVGVPATDVTITGNHIRGDTTNPPVKLDYSTRVRLAGNVIEGRNGDHHVYVTANGARKSVTGNTITSSTTGANYLILASSPNMVISDNDLDGNASLRGIILDASNIICTGNRIKNYGSNPLIINSGTNHIIKDNRTDESYDIASAATITLGNASDYFNITGTTTITSATASWAGRIVVLKFAGILTFTDGSNLKLNGDFVTTADDTITLVCDGTSWFEVARSVN